MSGPVDAGAPLLAVDSLGVRIERGGAPVVQDLSFTVRRGETLALVGESGCGKSMTALALMGLLPPGIGIARGRADFEGRNLLALDERELSSLRGDRIAMIFQEPMTALNPVLRVGEQIEEVMRRHQPVGRAAARARAIELLARVQVPEPQRRVDAYPHQLSGGQRQRVMIAAALACSPDLLIADEPTTALDVTTQAEILALLEELRAQGGLALILITHDLGIVGRMADRVLVMYAGRAVEEGPTAAVLRSPRHPYTGLLLAARPRLHGDRAARLAEIPGIVPLPQELPSGCAFAPRCPRAAAVCATGVPPALEVGAEHRASCVFATEAG